MKWLKLFEEYEKLGVAALTGTPEYQTKSILGHEVKIIDYAAQTTKGVDIGNIGTKIWTISKWKKNNGTVDPGPYEGAYKSLDEAMAAIKQTIETFEYGLEIGDEELKNGPLDETYIKNLSFIVCGTVLYNKFIKLDPKETYKKIYGKPEGEKNPTNKDQKEGQKEEEVESIKPVKEYPKGQRIGSFFGKK